MKGVFFPGADFADLTKQRRALNLPRLLGPPRALGFEPQILQRRHAGLIFGLPGALVRGGKTVSVADADRNQDAAAGAGGKLQAGIAFPLARENAHHRPVATAKDAAECLLVDAAGLGAVARMGVNPEPRELGRVPPLIDLPVKKICDR